MIERVVTQEQIDNISKLPLHGAIAASSHALAALAELAAIIPHAPTPEEGAAVEQDVRITAKLTCERLLAYLTGDFTLAAKLHIDGQEHLAKAIECAEAAIRNAV